MRPLIQKSLASTGAIIVSLALAGNAFAAGTHVRTKARAEAPSVRSVLDVAAIPPYPNYTPEATAVTPRYRVAAAPWASYPYPYPYRAARYPVVQGVDIGQVFGALFGGVRIEYRGRAIASGSGGSWESPSYDTSSPVDFGAAADQAASDAASAAAIQQANDSAALTASMAAAEQQNDAAQAATLQTEINAGM